MDLSHPSRVRGLKCDRMRNQQSFSVVAPLAGAWIEIHINKNSSSSISVSHPSRVRGLKSKRIFRGFLPAIGRTPRGCVD